MRRQSLRLLGLVIAGAAMAGETLQTVQRGVPQVQLDHPGNVFSRGEIVVIPVPEDLRDKTASWRAVDVADRQVAAGEAGDTCILGNLPVGWYRVSLLAADQQEVGWTAGAVIAAPTLPTPQDSPVCIDAATSWFARDSRPRREGFAYLASLAGVNWIRDRMSWGELERNQGEYAAPGNIYDAAAEAENKQGLKVLQVFHSTPGWATDKALDDGTKPGSRYPRDLRNLFSYTQAMARRYSGKVQAWEPWNEANISSFGGHSIDEMCTLQKAAYFGLKSGQSRITVCWNVYAGGGTALHTEGVLRNEAWPYFDTYNIHSYSPTTSYEREFANAREAASGKPIWISECGIRVPAQTPKPWGDLSRADEIKQAEFIPRSYASSLYAGVDRHFFFILGNYWENGIQFGLLRHDLTPRPGYVALAATGRFLAAARCLGKLSGDGYEMVAFAARPDGKEHTVLIGWADGEQALPAAVGTPEEAYDCFGREVRPALGPRPVFLLLPKEAAEKLTLTPPPSRAESRPGEPCPVVLQTQFKESDRWLQAQAHRLPAGRVVSVPLNLYNFSTAPARGTLQVAEAPAGWEVGIPEGELVIPSGDRLESTLRLKLSAAGKESLAGGWVTLRGDFGHLGKCVLSFRAAAEQSSLSPTDTVPLASAGRKDAWTMNINQGATMSVEEAAGGGVIFTMDFGDSDPWAYPYLILPPEEIPSADFSGIALTVELLEGSGTVRCQFGKENGAMYLGELDRKPNEHGPQKLMALFGNTQWGSYSKPDPDGKLDPNQIRRLYVGINAKAKTRVRLLVRDIQWLKF